MFNGACVLLGPVDSDAEDQSNPASAWESVLVKEVVDGDTITLTDGRRVRLIGINAPETRNGDEIYGKEAAQALTALIKNKVVFLEKDISETDQYGRTLRYVWLERKNPKESSTVREWMVNGILLDQGYAQPYTFPPDIKYVDWFITFAREAHTQGRGLWGIDPDGTTRGTPLY